MAAVILTVGVTLVALEWTLRNLLALRVWRRSFHLTPEYSPQAAAEQDDPPQVSVVVAAKDEQHNIGACLAGILSQDYPNFEIVVSNDRSRDDTAAIVREIAARDRRVSLVNVESLPDGWAGKNHAMQRGIERARGEWICMTDADCRMVCPQTLTVAMRCATDSGADMFSMLPTLKMVGFWEKLLQPVCSGVLVVWFPPERANDPKQRCAYANGMFMLIRRSAYETIGTHEAFKGSLIEDMDMARRIKTHGLRLRVVRSGGLVSVRMYTSLREIVRGWERIFIGAFQSLRGLVLALLVLLGRGLTCYVAAVVGLAMYAAPNASPWWLACGLVGAAGSIAETIMVARYLRQVGTHGWLALLYPMSCSMAAALLVKAMLLLRPGGKVIWRDTAYAARS